MKKLPKQPKPKKLPKKPKASASLHVWENWERRKNKTEADNKAAHAAWVKKCQQIKSDESKRQALLRKYKR